MVTAPVQKSVINDAGIAFTGHTEYLAERSSTEHVVMMLVGGGLRVALATTHLPLADVPRAITVDSLSKTLRVLDRDLRQRFRIARPRILVAGLNPHSGESGHLGREDIEVIAPAIAAVAFATRLPWLVVGPFAGVVADRVHRGRLLVAADLLRAALLGAVVLLLSAGMLSIPVLCVTGFALGAFETLFVAGAHAGVPAGG